MIQYLVPYSYRLRLVSISCDPDFTFSIDDHQMTIIEVDGENHQPLLVDSLRIFAGTNVRTQIQMVLTYARTGQRYSVVVRKCR